MLPGAVFFPKLPLELHKKDATPTVALLVYKNEEGEIGKD